MQSAREVLARKIGANPSASAPNYSDIPPSPFPPRGSSIGDVEVVERSSSGVAPPSCGGGTQRKNAAAKARKPVAKATAAGKGTTAGWAEWLAQRREVGTMFKITGYCVYRQGFPAAIKDIAGYIGQLNDLAVFSKH